MKLDVKSILVIALLGLTLIFGYKWFFNKDAGSTERLNQLEKEYKELEARKLELDKKIEVFKTKYDSLELVDNKLKNKLLKSESETRKAEIESRKSLVELEKSKREMNNLYKKIEQYKDSPANRIDDDLLESIKNKTK